MPSQPPTLIVLGAGRGSRFTGQGHKLAQRLNGRPVLAQTVSNALATGLAVKVVTTQALVPLVAPLVASRDIVVLPEAGTQPETGMGHSIAAGVAATPQAHGWLVVPADMPLMQPSTMQAVARALKDHAVVYAQVDGRRGHPVGFSPELYSELVQLRGDEGARRLLARYPAVAVDVDDRGALVDLDTEDDLRAAQA